MTLEKAIGTMPRFMHPEFERIKGFDDLLFQTVHEIDLAEEGELKWTKRQLHAAKMYAANCHIWLMESGHWQRETAKVRERTRNRKRRELARKTA